jgi:hypothetical protein
MTRVVISRVANGVTLKFGKTVMRTSFMGGFNARPEPTIEFDAPAVFKRDAKKSTSAWPKDAPPPDKVKSIYGDRSACGDYVVATFSEPKGFGGPEFIVRWNDVHTLAQELANSDVVAKSEAAS